MAICNPGTRQYIGARYVPRHMGKWSADVQYSALDVVLYTDGNSYTAKCFPPKGTVPTDTRYWSLSAQFNQQLASLESTTQEYFNKTDSLEKQVNCITEQNIQELYDESGDWSEAINSSMQPNTVIYLPSGTIQLTSPIVLKNGCSVIGHRLGTTLKINGFSAFTGYDSYLGFITLENIEIEGSGYENENVAECGIYTPDGVQFYNSTLRYIIVHDVQGCGILLRDCFGLQLDGCYCYKTGMNCFELDGGLGTILSNCNVGYNKDNYCGFRIYTRAILQNCNGFFGTGKNWLVAGNSTSDTSKTVDATTLGNRQYYIIVENCNVEDFTGTAFEFRYSGYFTVQYTSVYPAATGTYDTVFNVTSAQGSIIGPYVGLISKGATRSMPGDIIVDNRKTQIISMFNNAYRTVYTTEGDSATLPYIDCRYIYPTAGPTNCLRVSNMTASMYNMQLDGKNFGMATAAPSSGEHNVGDIVFNAKPVAGGTLGWICVKAGTPGTWKTIGTIEA